MVFPTMWETEASRSMERVKLNKKGRLTIPVSHREKLHLGKEVALILEEDHLIVCKTATVEEFKRV